MKKGALVALVLIIGLVVGLVGGAALDRYVLPRPENPDTQDTQDTSTDTTADTTDTTDTTLDTTIEPPEAAKTEEELISLAYQAARAIKSRDWLALSQMVHPEYGVVFVPYGTVVLQTNRCYTAESVADFGRNTNSYIWGLYDGRGDPIELTVAEYFTEFVYDFDYLSVKTIGVNTILRSGNSLENIKEVFPNGRFVDFYNHGTAEYGNLDWSSLRLVFEEYQGKLMLTAIIHNEFTV